MSTRTGFCLVAIILAVVAGQADAAQSRASDPPTLRANLERRFEILPLRDGVALRPRAGAARSRTIEVANGIIAVDGRAVSGGELRDLLGADADLILSLSYLSDDERRVISGAAAPAPAPSARPEPPAPPEPPRVEPPEPPRERRSASERRGRSGRGDDDRVRVGGSISVREGEIVNGDVVAVGGSATVDGEVRGAVVAIGGSVNLGPSAVVDEDVVSIGGRVNRDAGARVEGKITNIGIGSFDLSQLQLTSPMFWANWSSMFGSAFALAGTVMRVAILCLFAAIVIMLGWAHADRAGTRAMREPVKSWAIGFLAQLLFLPILIIGSVLLAITIVGIPLLILMIPLAIIGVCVISLVGFTGVAYRIGQVVGARLNLEERNRYLTTIVGIVVLLSPLLLARLLGVAGALLTPVAVVLGLLAIITEYFAWTLGFGAVILTKFSASTVPPPVIATDSPVHV